MGDNVLTTKNKESLSDLQKIILEILLETPDKTWNQDGLIDEALKREQRIKVLSDVR